MRKDKISVIKSSSNSISEPQKDWNQFWDIYSLVLVKRIMNNEDQLMFLYS